MLREKNVGCLIVFEAVSHDEAHTGLKLSILLSPPLSAGTVAGSLGLFVGFWEGAGSCSLGWP